MNKISQNSEKQTCFLSQVKCRFKCMYCFCVNENGTQSFVCQASAPPELYKLFSHRLLPRLTLTFSQAGLSFQSSCLCLPGGLDARPLPPGTNTLLAIYLFICVCEIGSCSTALAGLELDVHTRLLANFIQISYLCLPSSGIIGLSPRFGLFCFFFFFFKYLAQSAKVRSTSLQTNSSRISASAGQGWTRLVGTV